MTYPVWTNTPACVGTDTEMWFSQYGEPGYTEAKLIERICAGCPVKNQCLQYSLENTVEGYWAGTTPRTRQAMRKKLNIVPKPVGLAWEIHEYGKVI